MEQCFIKLAPLVCATYAVVAALHALAAKHHATVTPSPCRDVDIFPGLGSYQRNHRHL
jgi:hypothetical protein